MIDRSTAHATFSITRSYDAPPERVFAGFADPAIKRRWFAEGEGWEIEAFEVDFRSGGTERSRFRYRGGPLITNDTTFLNIVPDRRIILAYSMTVADEPISSSLATIEIEPSDGGTRLTYTEQGAFLDGKDQAETREAGCRGLLETLGEELWRQAAAA